MSWLFGGSSGSGRDGGRERHGSSNERSSLFSRPSLSSFFRKSNKDSSSTSKSKSSLSIDSIDSSSTIKPRKKKDKDRNLTITSLTGGYGFPRPPTASDNQSFRRAFPAIFSSSSLFPKPAGYIYSVRSALSSTYMTQSVLSPPQTPEPRRRHRSPSRRKLKEAPPPAAPTPPRHRDTEKRTKSRKMDDERPKSRTMDSEPPKPRKDDESSKSRKDDESSKSRKDDERPKSRKHHHRKREEASTHQPPSPSARTRDLESQPSENRTKVPMTQPTEAIRLTLTRHTDVIDLDSDESVTTIKDRAVDPSIDFLLPFGGLGEQFDSGIETEDTSEKDDDPGFTDNERSDPLSQQLPLLLSLVENTVSAYETIMDTNGSFAVAISGYKSVARRLLEQVDGFFNRNLSDAAASWGEVLEWVGGRRAKPALTTTEELEDLEAVFNGSPEKKFIYSACLEEPEVLDPAIIGLGRLYQAEPSPEVTAAYLTNHPQLRPLLQALAEMTPEELDILRSKRLASFLDVEDVIREDEEREIKECQTIDDGIVKSLEELDTMQKKLRQIKSQVLSRKLALQHRIQEVKVVKVPSEVKAAMQDIKRESIRVETGSRQHHDDVVESADEDDNDDTDTLLPDDSASQFNPFKPRRQFSTRLGTEAESRPSSPTRSVYSTLTAQSTARKRKNVKVKIALQDTIEESEPPHKGPLARLADEVLRRSSSRMSRFRELGDRSSTTTPTERNRTPVGSKLHRKPSHRSATPSSGRASSPPIQLKGVGGYGSSTPVVATTETGTIELKKSKKKRDGSKRKERGEGRERKSRRSHEHDD